MASDEIAVRLQNVTRRFGALVAVNALSLEVKRGSVFGLIGPNGAGKTTTFSMLCGFLRPTAGTIEILGHPPSRIVALKGRVGVLPQDALLPPTDRVLDVLTFYGQLQGFDRRKAQTEARRVLELVGLGDALHKKCVELSHGMNKRAALAQAFLGDPELVLLDEPTAGLDPKNAANVREIVESQRQHRTVIISSHNLHELQSMCDAAAIIDRGSIRAAAPMSELTRSSGEVRFQLASAPPVLDAVRALPEVTSVRWDQARSTLVVGFTPGKIEAEEVIGNVLRLLLEHGVSISGVAKGHSLEERVLELVR